MSHFLLIYDTALGELLAEPRVFENATTAVDAYMDAESMHRSNPDLQVVLIASDSIETVKITHANFFKRETIEQFIEDMLAPGCVAH